MRRRFGDLFTMPTMNGTLVLTLTPEGAKEILAGRESDFVVGFGVEAAAPIIGSNSLLMLSGERHQRERKLLSPTFHGARMRGYAPAMLQSAVDELEGWSPGREIVAHERMQAISLDVILHTVFGVQAPERMAAFREAVRLGVSEVSPGPIFFKFLQREFGGFGPWARFQRRLRHLDDLIYAQIAEARRQDEEREDVLAKLVGARYEDGTPLSDQAVRDQLLTLLVAGHETTGTTLAWVLYELHRNPEALAKVRDEVVALGPDPDPDALAGLPYLGAVCQETLRMHPILAEFFRTVKESYAFQGYQIPAGITLAASILVIQQNPELFPEPARFRPERFLERRFSPWEFAAFGGGHRHCIGAAFAMSELKIVLATLLSRVELSLGLERPLRTVRRNLTLAPEKGVPMRVERWLVPAGRRAA